MAELMIALIILGFGLLVIGAALPVGLTYTRKTVERSTGEAAAAHALDVIEQQVRLCRDVLDDQWDDWGGLPGTLRYRADLFCPRDPNTGEPAMDGARMYEPRIKVRPLLPVPIDPSNPDASYQPGTPGAYHDLEKSIKNWLSQYGGSGNYEERKEWDAFTANSNWAAPSIPSILAVYPPISISVVQNNVAFAADEFFADAYKRVQVPPGACRQALDRRVSWVAFYRRVSYAQDSDPRLYEFVTVAVRMSAQRRGFLRPSGGSVPTMEPGPTLGSSLETVSPVPWLVTFTQLPLLIQGTDYGAEDNRPLNPGFVDPATLTFYASPLVARVLPPGSIFIPAVNDSAPSAVPGNTQYAGFVPHAPETLPIYEVLERKQVGDNAFQIVVKNNGFYPWVAQGAPATAWPVWVIPPAFTGEFDLDADSYPVFEDRSPILAVARRIIWLPEVP